MIWNEEIKKTIPNEYNSNLNLSKIIIKEQKKRDLIFFFFIENYKYRKMQRVKYTNFRTDLTKRNESEN